MRTGILIFIFAVMLAGNVSGQDEVDASRVSDIVIEANNGGFHAIFYDPARKACVTSGTIIFSSEEHKPLLKKSFSAGDFRKVSIGIGEGRMALPVKLPGIAHGDRIKIEFGNVRKDVVVGYFGWRER